VDRRPTNPYLVVPFGIGGLPPELVRAGNAAAAYAGCTRSVWLALWSSFPPVCARDTTRELAVQSLKILRTNEQRWRADIQACREELVLAWLDCNRGNDRLARAGELSAEDPYRLAIRYYESLESTLLAGAVWAGWQPCGQVPAEWIGEHLHTLAKVGAGGTPDDVITGVPSQRPVILRRHQAGISAFERASGKLRAQVTVGAEISTLMAQTTIAAKARRAGCTIAIATLPKALTPTPRWDADRRELWFGETLCKRYRRPAIHQEKILATFQEDNWPARIDDPLPPGALRQCLDSINSALKGSPLIFEGDGTGCGILWRVRPISGT
jgi:hypothetical protein